MNRKPFRLRIDDRLELRQHRREDAAEIFALTDANRASLREWLPWLDGCRSSADTGRTIESSLCHARAGTGFAASIWFDGRIAGIAGFNDIDEADRVGNLGYWLGEAHRGRGLMTASARALIGHGFDRLGLNRITIAAASANRRSRAVAERLGFWFEGITHDAEWLYDRFVDHAVYGVTWTQWRKMSHFCATSFAGRQASHLPTGQQRGN